MEGGQSGTYLRLTRASSGPRVSVAKPYRDETKQKCEYFGQITVAFLSSRSLLLHPMAIHLKTSSSFGILLSAGKVARIHRSSTRALWITLNEQHEQACNQSAVEVVSCILLLRKATVIWPKYSHFCFVSSLYVLATLTRVPDDALVNLR